MADPKHCAPHPAAIPACGYVFRGGAWCDPAYDSPIVNWRERALRAAATQECEFSAHLRLTVRAPYARYGAQSPRRVAVPPNEGAATPLPFSARRGGLF